jgi:hypothetical protein
MHLYNHPGGMVMLRVELGMIKQENNASHCKGL